MWTRTAETGDSLALVVRVVQVAIYNRSWQLVALLCAVLSDALVHTRVVRSKTKSCSKLRLRLVLLKPRP